MELKELDQYTEQLLALLPVGAAWDRNSPGLRGLMTGLAEELVRIDARGSDLLAESLPGSVVETLERWEADYGLPEDYVMTDQTAEQRLASLKQKYLRYGSQSREFLLSLVTAFGVQAVIEEYKPRNFGDDFGGYYYGTEYAFVVHFLIGMDGVEDKEAVQFLIENMISDVIHAHKIPLFSFSGVPVYATATLTDSAETGTLSDWYYVGGGELFADDSEAFDGNYSITTINETLAIATRDIDLTELAGINFAFINGGSALGNLSWLSKGQTDGMTMGLWQYDDSGVLLDSVMDDISHSAGWISRHLSVALKPGVKRVSLVIYGEWGSADSAPKAWLDMVGFEVAMNTGTVADPVPSKYPVTLPIENHDAEGDLNAWTVTAGSVRHDHTWGAKFGNDYFYPENNAYSEMHQDLLLPDYVIPDVDANQLNIQTGYWNSSASDAYDKSGVRLFFLDANGTEISSATGAYRNGNWFGNEWRDTHQLPAGTRTVRYQVRFDRDRGTSNDAYTDMLRATLFHR